jgi:hypothetical protein
MKLNKDYSQVLRTGRTIDRFNMKVHKENAFDSAVLSICILLTIGLVLISLILFN